MKSVFISLNEIFEIVSFDVDNVFFTLGPNNILKQISGIPMGSPMSPAIAIIVCIFYENKCHNTHPCMMKRYLSLRYMDDIIRATIAKKNKWKKAEKNLDSMAVSYHENMKLKEIRFYGQGTFNYLASTVSFCKNSILATYYNKNKPMIFLKKPQKVLRLQHFLSRGSTEKKIATLIGMFHLISSSCCGEFTNYL